MDDWKEKAHNESDRKASEAAAMTAECNEWLWQKIINFRLNQFAQFPQICEMTRRENYLKMKELKELSKQGKFTESYGWSPDGSFKHDFEIPSDLYHWMVQLVDRDFWDNKNRKLWRTFMHRICRGDAPWEVYAWISKQYGDIYERIAKLKNKMQFQSPGIIQPKGVLGGADHQETS